MSKDELVLALSFAMIVGASYVKLRNRFRMWNLYPARDFLSDARGWRMFWIDKIAPLFIALGVVGAAWCAHIWWVLAWACVFYAGVILMVILATRRHLKMVDPLRAR